ncbi:MAG: hypothetical protein AVDCRST_MAG47-1001, partial [uncultured Nocardioidaceae bacterium]
GRQVAQAAHVQEGREVPQGEARRQARQDRGEQPDRGHPAHEEAL